jgi:DNA ligase (NAD+)
LPPYCCITYAEVNNSISRFFASGFGAPAGDGKTFHPLKTCPECGSKLCAEVGGAEQIWQCPNPDCPAQVRRGLVHWCSPEAMDIAGGDNALVTQLVKSGLVRDIAELYQLKVGEVANLERMDEKAAKNFVDAIAASKTRDAWRVLFGLGILHVGSGVAKSLARHFPTLDHFLDANTNQLMEAEGVSEVITNSVVQWWDDPVNRRLVQRLRKAGLNFKSELYQPSS